MIANTESLGQLASDAARVLLDASLKGLVLLAMAGVLVLAMRKASAAARQMVWLLAMAGLIILPPASMCLPSWEILPTWADVEIAAPTAPPAGDSSTITIPILPVGPSRGTDQAGPTAVTPAPSQSRRAGAYSSRLVAGKAPEQTRSDTNPTAATAAAGGSARTRTSWLAPLVVAVWLIGTLVCLLPLVLGRVSLWRLARRAEAIAGGSWIALHRRAAAAIGLRQGVAILQSHGEPMPMVWGTLKPKLLLPAEAEGWPPDRRWVVLLHELAHVKRRDCLAKLVAHMACAVYWFNPLCWIAFKLMQREAEVACDDLVLNCAAPAAIRTDKARAVRPSDYAQHLLEIASGLKSGMLTTYSSIAMARKSKLEERVSAILDAHRNRRAMTRIGILVAAVIVAAVAIPLATIHAGETRPASRESIPVHESNQKIEVAKPVAKAQPAPIKYTSRRPDYSLRKEPMRIAPRTLGSARPAPADAVVFGWPIRWWWSHWSSKQNTGWAHMEQLDNSARFAVLETQKRKVWVKYFDVPIDAAAYPIAIMTYRARNTADGGGYVLYLDDTSGPDYGGLLPFNQGDIVPDGEQHTLTADLRELKPIGPLIGLAVGVRSADEGCAEFELIDLRFEAASPAAAVPFEGEAITIRVIDEAGRALPGAQVTVDAERANWAITAAADAEGNVRITPYTTRTGRHMIRAESPGHVPTEAREVTTATRFVTIVLQPAVVYTGVAQDDNGQPLAGAVIKVDVPQMPPAGLWTRRDATALTGPDGSWRTPPLPLTDRVSIRTYHPLKTVDRPETVYTCDPTGPDGVVPVAPTKKPDDSKDPRRPGYDPFKIFRELS
jgi:beta-lactamase regulating signal transducer with metallopeptidase domain